MKAHPDSARVSQVDVGLVIREKTDGWGIESICFQRPNMVSCEIVTGPTRTPLVGAYLLSSKLEHLPDVKEALQCFNVRDSIFLGDLNVDLDDVQSSRSQWVVDLLTEYGLIKLVRYFRQRRWFRDLKTWTQVRQVTDLCSK